MLVLFSFFFCFIVLPWKILVSTRQYRAYTFSWLGLFYLLHVKSPIAERGIGRMWKTQVREAGVCLGICPTLLFYQVSQDNAQIISILHLWTEVKNFVSMFDCSGKCIACTDKAMAAVNNIVKSDSYSCGVLISIKCHLSECVPVCEACSEVTNQFISFYIKWYLACGTPGGTPVTHAVYRHLWLIQYHA